MGMKKNYTETFKAQVVLELLKEEKTVAQISAEYEVHPTQLHKWKNIAIQNLPSLFSSDQKKAETVTKAHERQIGELYSEIGKLTTQLAWLKKKSGINPD